jgi:hypothetical protein
VENQGRRGKRLCIAASRCCRHGAPICRQHFAAAAGPQCFSFQWLTRGPRSDSTRIHYVADSNQMVYIACCVCSHSHPRRCPPPSRANSRDPTYTQIAELRVWLRLWLWLWQQGVSTGCTVPDRSNITPGARAVYIFYKICILDEGFAITTCAYIICPPMSRYCASRTRIAASSP